MIEEKVSIFDVITAKNKEKKSLDEKRMLASLEFVSDNLKTIRENSSGNKYIIVADKIILGYYKNKNIALEFLEKFRKIQCKEGGILCLFEIP